MKVLNASIIGLGDQSIYEHIPALLSSDRYKLVAAVDPNPLKRKRFRELFDIDVDLYDNAEDMFQEHKIDAAIVAVPHDQYLPLIKLCAQNSIHVLKEKPFSVSLQEAYVIKRIAEKYNIKIMTCSQRRFHPIYQSFKEMIKQIGKITTINAFYTISSSNPNRGWRRDFRRAGGGVLLDMGYHIIDLIVWLFGQLTINYVFFSTNRPELYNVDDTASFGFRIGEIYGHAFISCVYPYKKEEIVVLGTEGSVILRKDYLARFNRKQNIVEELENTKGWKSAMMKQLEYFYSVVINNEEKYMNDPDSQIKHHVKLIEKLYKLY